MLYRMFLYHVISRLVYIVLFRERNIFSSTKEQEQSRLHDRVLCVRDTRNKAIIFLTSCWSFTLQRPCRNWPSRSWVVTISSSTTPWSFTPSSRGQQGCWLAPKNLYRFLPFLFLLRSRSTKNAAVQDDATVSLPLGETYSEVTDYMPFKEMISRRERKSW